jgi:lipid A disaccharide synthetase
MVAGEPRATCSPAAAGRAAAALAALHAAGIGGPQMAQGFQAWWPHDKLAVRGYVEVLRHYREISGIREAAGAKRLLASGPACSSAWMRPTSTWTSKLT